jgi:hypothetical protein
MQQYLLLKHVRHADACYNAINMDILARLLPAHHRQHVPVVAAFTGNVSPEAKQLCDITQKALHEAIKICAPGVPYNKIGKVGRQGFHLK